MRILVTIPHFYNAQGGGMYGSLRADPKPRRNALMAAIFGLHNTYGPRQGLLVKPIVESNTGLANKIDVVVCTTGDSHLIAQLGLPDGLYRHHATSAAPMFLGFECHALLRDALGAYDYYCFLEDDLLLSDPMLFQKLNWFNKIAGDGAVLQPNRFEIALVQSWHRHTVRGPWRSFLRSSLPAHIADRAAVCLRSGSSLRSPGERWLASPRVIRSRRALVASPRVVRSPGRNWFASPRVVECPGGLWRSHWRVREGSCGDPERFG